VIEHIERFRPELQRQALTDGNPLEQGRVDVEQGWAANRAARLYIRCAGRFWLKFGGKTMSFRP